MPKQNCEKFDEILLKLNLLLNRVDGLNRNISSFNERLSNVEDNMESLSPKFSEIASETATENELKRLEKLTNDSIA